MSVTLDGQVLFDEHQLQIKLDSISRDLVERAVPGLDGVLSIDLGGRGRKIEQRGVLRAKSRSQLDNKISAISTYMDGDTHKLLTNSGEEFDNLRMDVFKVSKERASSSDVVVDYEIVYTQLNV